MPILERTLELSSESTGEPITIEEAKSWLRVVTNDENTDIKGLIKVARKMVEDDARRAYVRKTYKLRLREFPTEDFIQLERPAVSSISSISYVNSTGGTSTLSTSVYELDANELPGYVRLKYDQEWPSTRDIQNAVTITFLAGSTAPQADTPIAAKQAIKLLIDDMYCNRGTGCGCTGTPAYDRLIGMLRWGDYR